MTQVADLAALVLLLTLVYLGLLHWHPGSGGPRQI